MEELKIKFKREELQWVTFNATITEEDWNNWKTETSNIPDEVKALTFKEVCDIFEGKKKDIYWDDTAYFRPCVLNNFGDYIRNIAMNLGPQDSNWDPDYDAEECYEVNRGNKRNKNNKAFC